MTDPTPPAGLADAGAAFWAAVCADYELAPHELVLLEQAARTVDLLHRLEAAAQAGPLVDDAGRIHPAIVEARQCRGLLARLVASLRIPELPDDDDQADGDAGPRPQRRGAARGAYGLRAVDGGQS